MLTLDTSAAAQCSQASHAHVAAHEWHTLVPHADASGLAWGTCRLCHSTLCRPLPVVHFWLVPDDHIRVERTDGHMDLLTLDEVEEDIARIALGIRDHGDTDPRFCGWDTSVDAALGECDAAWDARKGAA